MSKKSFIPPFRWWIFFGVCSAVLFGVYVATDIDLPTPALGIAAGIIAAIIATRFSGE